MEVRRSPRKKSASPVPIYNISSGSSSDSSEEEAQEKADIKDFKPSHSFKPSHPEVRRSPRKKSPSPAPVFKISSGSNSSDSSEEESQEKADKDFKPSHSFKPSHEVRRSPRKKSPSPIYKIHSGSNSSDSSEEEAQEKADKDFKPSHPEPSSSCSSASSTPKKKRRRKESTVEETARSESEDGSRSETELHLQSNLSGVPRKRKHAKRPSKLGNRKARWRQGLPEVAVRDYDHSMVKGFLKQVSVLQQKHFNVESWDADDISSDDDDDDDDSPLREEEEDFPGTRVVPSETFIERLQREI